LAKNRIMCLQVKRGSKKYVATMANS